MLNAELRKPVEENDISTKIASIREGADRVRLTKDFGRQMRRGPSSAPLIA